MTVDVFTYTLTDGVLTIEGEGELDKETVFQTKESPNIRKVNFNELDFHTLIIKERVTSIEANCFEDCKGLQEISMPESMEWIDFEAFKGCNSLHTVKLPQNIHHVASDAFTDTSITYLEEEGLLYFKVGDNPHYLFMGCKDNSLQSIKIAEGTIAIADQACQGMENLKDVRFPDSLKWIGRWCFTGCPIHQIYLPDNIVPSDFYIDIAFEDVPLSTLSAPWSIYVNEAREPNSWIFNPNQIEMTVLFRKPGSSEIGAIFNPPFVPRK